MRGVIAMEVGLTCLCCAGGGAKQLQEVQGDGLSPIKGQAGQHCSSGKHKQAVEAARLVPSMRHLFPASDFCPWLMVAMVGTGCTWCAAIYGPWPVGEELPTARLV